MMVHTRCVPSNSTVEQYSKAAQGRVVAFFIFLYSRSLIPTSPQYIARVFLYLTQRNHLKQFRLSHWCTLAVSLTPAYLFIGTHNFHYCENYEPQKTSFFIVRTESIRKYLCIVYHQLSQYIAKLRRITIDLCKSRLVTIAPRNHSLSQH